jgi:hypothetical protein
MQAGWIIPSLGRPHFPALYRQYSSLFCWISDGTCRLSRRERFTNLGKDAKNKKTLREGRALVKMRA